MILTVLLELVVAVLLDVTKLPIDDITPSPKLVQWLMQLVKQLRAVPMRPPPDLELPDADLEPPKRDPKKGFGWDNAKLLEYRSTPPKRHMKAACKQHADHTSIMHPL
jgi:hypothetical protein